jgi:hypothetical protein
LKFSCDVLLEILIVGADISADFSIYKPAPKIKIRGSYDRVGIIVFYFRADPDSLNMEPLILFLHSFHPILIKVRHIYHPFELRDFMVRP